MQIKRFIGTGIHGYLDFDVKFNDDVTFLTGINGTGKTTVIQAIVALISPTFFVLCSLEYKEIQVEIDHQSHRLVIKAAQQKENFIELSISSSRDTLAIQKFVADPDELSYRISEKEDTYYKELATAHASSPVMVAINSLPTPMFLDLDRKAKLLPERTRAGSYVRQYHPRRTRNIFAFSLARSLDLATSLAESEYRDTLIAVARAGDQLRRKMILDLLELEPQAVWRGGPLATPTREELDNIKAMRQNLGYLPHILQIDKSDIEHHLLPTLDTLEEVAKQIPANFNVIKELPRLSPNSAEFNALISWSSNRPQLKKILKMVEHLKDYGSRRDKQNAQSIKYRRIVNDFFKDSGKEIYFDESGYLWFRIDGRDDVRPRQINSLSSGEGQLFVIITHLFFNPDAQNANVFIIDEPELSLHVRWQELFVESIMAANPNVQYILATHSPSIILNRLDRCRDFSKANRRGIRG